MGLPIRARRQRLYGGATARAEIGICWPVKAKASPRPTLYLLRAPDGYAAYCSLCPTCGGRRGWRTAAGAAAHLAEIGQVGRYEVEAYIPAPNSSHVCGCAIA